MLSTKSDISIRSRKVGKNIKKTINYIKIALHCIALHYITLHYMTLHYITYVILSPKQCKLYTYSIHVMDVCVYTINHMITSAQ